jgi:ABC-type nickel/cobalt efflux system permease component RcnA
MIRRAARALAVATGTVALLVLAPGAASAHPLGNFTVNRYSGLVVGTDAVTVEHVLDLAEIPTAQRSPAIDTDGDGMLARPELAAWAARECAAATQRLQLHLAGRRLDLRVTGSSASTTPGQADLPILRLDCHLRAAAPLNRATSLDFVDRGARDQVGWREVTARGDGVTLVRSDVPRRSRSARLTAYPRDLLSSPLDVRGARLEVRPGGAHLRPATSAADAGVAVVEGGVTGSFQDLATRYDGSLLVALSALLAAIALGAAHAAAPGHGKTIMAFYLSGRREGALRAAGTVGATVTVTHTAGVLALGALVSAGTAFVPARVYPWLSVLSGLLVVAVGLTLLRAARQGHVHGAGGHTHLPGEAHDHGRHDHVGQGHGHPHPHALESHDAHAAQTGPVGVLLAEPEHEPEHEHEHEHEHPEGQPSHRGLVAMGLAGGLLPSPSAVIVFLGALAVGHPWFGVLLVAGFGVGMATTLAVVGVVVMRLRERVEQRLVRRPRSRFSVALRVLPVLTALTVVSLGALLALRGLGSLGA